MPLVDTDIPHCGKRDAHESLTVCSASTTAYQRFPSGDPCGQGMAGMPVDHGGPGQGKIPSTAMHLVLFGTRQTAFQAHRPKEGSSHERLRSLR